MINVPNNIKIDLRKQIAKGELNDRIQGMMLEKKYDPISKAQWNIKQNEIYLNTLRVKNDISFFAISIRSLYTATYRCIISCNS